MRKTPVEIHVASSFDEPTVTSDCWNDLLDRADTPTVFLTREWQHAWWQSFGRGRLLLITAIRDGRPVALAPLFAEAGMVFFVGSGGSDYLGFLGDVGDPEVLDAILLTARESTNGFVGFRFYHLLETSRAGLQLSGAAERCGWRCFDEGILPAPALTLAPCRDAAEAALSKKSLLRHERYFTNNGELKVCHWRRSEEILPLLPEFFEQHVERWRKTPCPSLFNDPSQRDFYTRLTRTSDDAGWLRFTRLVWNGRAIAAHFGFHYRGSYLWYKPSFAIELARRSPGEVLLRQLLIAATREGAQTFDFGLGDEPFKRRFSTHVRQVHTWGLYP